MDSRTKPHPSFVIPAKAGIQTCISLENGELVRDFGQQSVDSRTLDWVPEVLRATKSRARG